MDKLIEEKQKELKQLERGDNEKKYNELLSN